MAPSTHLLPRQPNRFDDDNGSNISRTAIMGIVIGTAILIFAVAITIWIRIIRRRRAWRRAGGGGSRGQSLPLHTRQRGAATSAAAGSSPPYTNPNLIPSSPYSSKRSGYGNPSDQNQTQTQSLLGNAAVPGTAAWIHANPHHHHDDGSDSGVGSTQDGFGFTTANITQPANVVNLDVPPPRYEEATGLGSAAPDPPSISSAPHGGSMH